MGVGGKRHAPFALPTGRGGGTHCIGGWPVWMDAENLAPPQGFDPRTFQPTVRRYTDSIPKT
jgi:hypothetical protein